MMAYSSPTKCKPSARLNTRKKPQPASERASIAQIGQFALALAWVVTAYSIVASLLGILLKNDNLIASGRNAAIGTFVCVTTAIGCLGYLFSVSDFSVRYV